MGLVVARATDRQSAGPSVTSSRSAWEEAGTAEAATASSVVRMEVVVVDTTRDTTQDTTRDTTRGTTLDTTPDTTRYCLHYHLQCFLSLLYREVTLDAVECEEEPAETAELPLQTWWWPPGPGRRRRRSSNQPSDPPSRPTPPASLSLNHKQTFFQKQFYGKFSVKYIYLLIK